MRYKKRATKTFFCAKVLRNFPLRMDRKLISRAIDVGLLQTFDSSWNYDNGFGSVNDVFCSFSSFIIL